MFEQPVWVWLILVVAFLLSPPGRWLIGWLNDLSDAGDWFHPWWLHDHDSDDRSELNDDPH
jgi:hypothetical protein